MDINISIALVQQYVLNLIEVHIENSLGVWLGIDFQKSATVCVEGTGTKVEKEILGSKPTCTPTSQLA